VHLEPSASLSVPKRSGFAMSTWTAYPYCYLDTSARENCESLLAEFSNGYSGEISYLNLLRTYAGLTDAGAKNNSICSE
jgi:hypothetical protein